MYIVTSTIFEQELRTYVCSAKVHFLKKEVVFIFEVIFIYEVIFIFEVVFINQKFMSVAQLSQTKKSERGIAEPSFCIDGDNVPNDRH